MTHTEGKAYDRILVSKAICAVTHPPPEAMNPPANLERLKRAVLASRDASQLHVGLDRRRPFQLDLGRWPVVPFQWFQRFSAFKLQWPEGEP